ncbi:hypothetical protein [Actinomadura chokoriensis]|uniref:Lipoprotein n=1 Tax=Actinomadura chokoriensis TaxID=454156 RepID=A0ABV4QVG8_9ACTN
MRRPRWMRALPAVAACAVLAGCGIRPTGIISAGTGPGAQAHADTITVYLVRGHRLLPVTRPGLPGQPNLAIEQLTVPPTGQERAIGLRTEVHEPLEAYKLVTMTDPVGDRPQMVVRSVERRNVPKNWSRIARAQIACTAQAIPGIESVRLLSALNATRSRLETLTCDQFADLLE